MNEADRMGRRRAVVGGAFAVLALVVIAAGSAFACSAGASATVRPARAEAGTMVTYSATGFDPGGSAVALRWGGASGTLLTSANVDASGGVSAAIRVPDNAPAGNFYQITGTQRILDTEGREVFRSASAVVEVPASAPAPVAAPTPQPAPAPQPVSQQPVAQPAAQPSAQPQPAASPAPSAPRAAATGPARLPAAAPAAAPRTEPAPVAAVPAPPSPAAPEAQTTPAPAPDGPAAVDRSELHAIDAPVTDIAPAQPLVVNDPAAMGGPRTIDDGTPLWVLVPLVGIGLTLFAAASAVVVSEVRSRRAKAKVTV